MVITVIFSTKEVTYSAMQRDLRDFSFGIHDGKKKRKEKEKERNVLTSTSFLCFPAFGGVPDLTVAWKVCGNGKYSQ